MIARNDLRRKATVAVLKRGTHHCDTARNSKKYLPQSINETITSSSASATQVIALTINFDVQHAISVPIWCPVSSSLFNTVSYNADASFAYVRHIVSPTAVWVIGNSFDLASG